MHTHLISEMRQAIEALINIKHGIDLTGMQIARIVRRRHCGGGSDALMYASRKCPAKNSAETICRSDVFLRR